MSRGGRSIVDGTAQHQRFPGALAEGRFGVDETSFAQRVVMAEALARQLRFTDLQESAGGDWGPLFVGDESLVLARLAALDLSAIERALGDGFDAAPLPQVARQVVALAHAVDGWLKALDGQPQPAAQAVAERIRQLVEQQLGDDLRWVHDRFGDSVWQGNAVGRDRARLHAVWRRPAAAPQGVPDQRLNIGAEPQHLHDAQRDGLRARYVGFLGALAGLRTLAAELLPDSLLSGQHEPAAGLLMAFLQLYGTVQQRLNGFTQLHASFYHGQCLGLRAGLPRADGVHLVCRRELRAPPELWLPAGFAFEAGRDEAGRTIEFRTDTTLRLTDARVAALCTLRLERDALISPERDFGYVTRIKAACLPVPDDGPVADPPLHWPLFGGGAGMVPSRDARVGLAVSSPLLWLQEGVRDIRVVFRASAADEVVSLQALVEAAVEAPDEAGFHRALGRVFSHWLVLGTDVLAEPDRGRLRQAALRVMGPSEPVLSGVGDPLGLVHGATLPSRELVFEQLFSGVFDLQLSASTGWLRVEAADVDPEPGGGLRLDIRLHPEAPPIVGCDPLLHGPEWPTRQPVLQLTLGTQGRLYAHSLLADLQLLEAVVTVQVRGLRDLVVSNHLGRLDATKAFQPFGPLPTLSSYLVFGAPEMARKPLSRVTVHVEWSGLPLDPGGFSRQYHGYPETAAVPGEGSTRPVAALGILRDGQWQACTGVSARQPLFAAPDAAGRLPASLAFDVDAASVRKHSRATHDDLRTSGNVRNGLFRWQLTGPRGGFGHAAYPAVLADAVTWNARSRRPRPLPLPPYTPLIEQMAVDYEARAAVRMDRHDAGDEADGEASRLFHLHPFGIEALRSAAAGARNGLLPRLDTDGNLFIGLAAEAPVEGPLSLLFHLADSAAVMPLGPGVQPRPGWACLRQDRWWPLPPVRVLSDGTSGLLTSGIVVLDLPAGLDGHNTVMPAGLVWLRVSADPALDMPTRLHAVQAQAVVATRVLTAAAVTDADTPAAAAATGFDGLPPGRVGPPLRSLPGLAGVVQVGPSFGARAAPDRPLQQARAGERLQHKLRASTPWDIERLVLDRFPAVYKAKCFSATELDGAAGPGGVLVAVVPAAPRNVPGQGTAAPQINAIELRRMADDLQRLASPFARIRVRNASYERIQVRCVVQAMPDLGEGVVLRRVQQAIVEYLSPWFDGGCEPRFGWVLRCEDVQASLRRVPGVAAISQLSLLQVGCDDAGFHDFTDTARPEAAGGHVRRPGEACLLRPLAPWSLALPMAEHILTAADLSGAQPVDPAPQATGIARLAVGRTFVVGKGRP